MKKTSVAVQLEGVRPLMFDKYAGDFNTVLPTIERLYLDSQQRLIIPAINIYSMLCAENTKSVCKMLMGKQGKTIGLGIASYTSITSFEIAVMRNGVQLCTSDFGTHIHEHYAVARTKTGTPNNKKRPLVTLPWSLDFVIEYIENPYCTLHNLRQVMELGGILGLGTFRPFFGRFNLARFEVV